jgi:hypothetical protein
VITYHGIAQIRAAVAVCSIGQREAKMQVAWRGIVVTSGDRFREPVLI